MIKEIKSTIRKKIISLYENKFGSFFFKQNGHCPCCDENVEFVSRNSWLRDYFKCSNCYSLPRERALMHVIESNYPNWKTLEVHESSPGNRGHSLKLKSQCKNYTASHYYSNNELGVQVEQYQNENLEQLTLADNSIDIFVTSDVMEHIYDPEKAFKEIYRTLKPGGAHIFSVPLINKHRKTQRWAKKGTDGSPEFLYEPEWHGNPIDESGSPVTMHWGFDIVDFIKSHTLADVWIEHLDDLSLGIRAEYIEIVIQMKQKK